MALHNFDTDLTWSKQNAAESFWEVIYRKEFPDFESMSGNITDLTKQKAGIDRVITLKGGAQIFIDEKVQKSTWSTLFLETWSSLEHSRPGWVRKSLHCDYIAYVFLDTRQCWFIPFQQLRRAFEQNEQAWTQTYGTKSANNKTYTTVGVPVPIDIVLDACDAALYVTWQAQDGIPYAVAKPVEPPPELSPEPEPSIADRMKALAARTDWRVGLRCGITHEVCRLCKGVPCRDSTPLERPAGLPDLYYDLAS